MIPKLTYTNLETGEEIEFSALSVYHTNVSDEAIGLSDVAASLTTMAVVGGDGVVFASARVEPRTITIKGKIRAIGNLEKSQLRRALAKALNPAQAGRLRYSIGEFARSIDCRAERAPTITPGRIVDQYSVDLLCPNPYWADEGGLTDEIAGWGGGFEWINSDEDPQFQISASSLTKKVFEFGSYSESQIINVVNAGDVPGGCVITFTASGSVSGPGVKNVDTEEYLRVNIDMVAGDVLVVDTRFGYRTATLLRGTEEMNVYRYVDADAVFLQLAVGANNLKPSVAGGMEQDIGITITHDNFYLGV